MAHKIEIMTSYDLIQTSFSDISVDMTLEESSDYHYDQGRSEDESNPPIQEQ